MSPISVDQLIDAIEQKNGYALDGPQQEAIRHEVGPQWIIAGPGTGKTEVLVVRCLKLICCNDVSPKSVMITTFTEKAARNLEDRIADSMLFLTDRYSQLSELDIGLLRIGTLHGLCNEILQEFRYVEYQNLRLLDQLENRMMIRARVARSVRDMYPRLRNHFDYLFGNLPNPNLWQWTKVLDLLFDAIVNYQIDVNTLRRAGSPWMDLAATNDFYEAVLQDRYSCDFARLQRHFLQFLISSQGEQFLVGDGSGQHPPLLHVLVDEYQDTNPIQEDIYFRLADVEPHNLTVVGDDDQALYRFRGGTVECMVGFWARCEQQWNVRPRVISLVDNHRSDTDIVRWCNTYITSFPHMAQPNARAPGKPPLVDALGPLGSYPSVAVIRGNSMNVLADSMADTLQGLRDNGIIEDYSQCVLLLRSVKDTPNNAGHYMSALETRGIPVYNPRARAFLDQPEVQQVLGGMVSILDRDYQALQAVTQPGIPSLVRGWVTAFWDLIPRYPDLGDYFERSREAIACKEPSTRITPAFTTILYRLFAHQPFTHYQQDPAQDLRLSKLTRLLEAFSSERGRELWTDQHQHGVVDQGWLRTFYYVFCGYLETHGIDDDENEEVVCPPGLFPVMTVHQSKGLEFDFVFVGTLGRSVSPGNAHRLEQHLQPFRLRRPVIEHRPEDAAWHDEIRFHYVAYSRAKYALILLATSNQMRNRQSASFTGNGGSWVRQNIFRL